MADAVIELDTRPDRPRGPRPIAVRWLLAALAGLLVLGGTAVAIGQAGRPKPPGPPPIRNYVSSPGFSLYVGNTGNAVFIIDIRNFGANPVTVSKPHITIVDGTSDVHVYLSVAEPTPDLNTAYLAWLPSPASVQIPPWGDGHLAVGYHVDCALEGQRGPYVIAATVLAAAGSLRTIRNVMPDLNPSATYGTARCPRR